MRHPARFVHPQMRQWQCQDQVNVIVNANQKWQQCCQLLPVVLPLKYLIINSVADVADFSDLCINLAFLAFLCSAIPENRAFLAKFSEPSFRMTNEKFSMTNFQFRLSALVAACRAVTLATLRGTVPSGQVLVPTSPRCVSCHSLRQFMFLPPCFCRSLFRWLNYTASRGSERRSAVASLWRDKKSSYMLLFADAEQEFLTCVHLRDLRAPQKSGS